MPRGDGTGPRGLGAMSGRAAGLCAGFGAPGYMNPMAGRGGGFGMGSGRGRGFGGGGRGWRNRFFATGLPGWMRFGGYGAPSGYPMFGSAPDPEMERQALRNQADAMESELNLIRRRLAEMESGTAA
ncbi:MAG TPA: DUF5320 domain-containing protein [Syntrophales bacterium]|nr:DUF5320 domain-containing protein [Syntrophales bacterium]